MSKLSPEKYRDLRTKLKRFDVAEEMPNGATSAAGLLGQQTASFIPFL